MLTTLKKRCESGKNALLRLHRSEQGAEGIEKLLIIGAIVLPLLIVLVIFRKEISTWVREKWDNVQSESEASDF
ncbi:hypothetical protein KS4_20950 [Poriferisphaera corsica]|uniref:Uncharacterized protein n=1 Tax=Poriferisphaera corsica TaxID=2528020 RepID=A0A517YUU5_9BACT|nr:hypothetical protein [Poriferisphaera corsica]QDU34033.1 hypothetical protein KS4_20950 [Poriferisphaera corsica]